MCGRAQTYVIVHYMYKVEGAAVAHTRRRYDNYMRKGFIHVCCFFLLQTYLHSNLGQFILKSSFIYVNLGLGL